MAMTLATQVGADFPGWANSELTDQQRAEAIEKLRESWAKRNAPSTTVSGPTLFTKTGPMEYRASTRDAMVFLMGMLDMLQLGYTVETELADSGVTRAWVITFYDPATLKALAD